MASGDTGNVVPGNRLRVRVPCPPLERVKKPVKTRAFFTYLLPRKSKMLVFASESVSDSC